jgi:hypothetical protein
MLSTANSYTTRTLGFTEGRSTFNKAERKMSEHPGGQRADRVRNGFNHRQAARHRKAPLSNLTEYVIALADLLEAEGKMLRRNRLGVGDTGGRWPAGVRGHGQFRDEC